MYLLPKYYLEFSCIGSNCEDTCCNGWNITIDKKTYLKYKNSKYKVFQNDLKDKLRRDRKSESDGTYGRIKLDESGNCKFLEGGLCSIQLEAGPEFLSETCKNYPRNENYINGSNELYLTLSCPEAARKCLFNKNGIALENVELDKIKNANNSFNMDIYSKMEAYFWDIRLFALNLLQFREYTLDARLIILGMFLKKLNELNLENRHNEILGQIENFYESIESKNFDSLIESMEGKPDVKIQIVEQLINKDNDSGISNLRFVECINDMSEGFAESNGEIPKKYEENKNEYLKPYLDQKSYVLENFIVNEFFGKILPFSHDTIWESYIYLCIIYSVNYTILVGMAGKYETMTDELIIKLIQSFSKANLHDKGYIENIVKFIEKNELDNLAHMAILVLE